MRYRLPHIVHLLILLLVSTVGLKSQELPSTVVTTSMDIVDNQDMQTSLREALSYALMEGLEVTFNIPSTQSNTIILQGAALPNITHDITINGANRGPNGGMVTIDGQGQFRPFVVSHGVHFVVDSLRIINGIAPSLEGGGAFLNQGHLVLRHCMIDSCMAMEGGAIVSEPANGVASDISLMLEDCRLSRNEAQNGSGGAVRVLLGDLILRGNELSGNKALRGGAVGFSSLMGTGHLEIEGCKFIYNKSIGEDSLMGGGAMMVDGCDLELKNSYFVNNDSYLGGAVWFGGPRSLLVENCSFETNHSESGGGAFVVRHTSDDSPISFLKFDLRRCSFLGNTTTDGSGGAILIDGRDVALSLDNGMFVENYAGGLQGWGGAVACPYSHPTTEVYYGAITNSSFVSNSSQSVGPAIYYNRYIGLANNVFVHNTTADGGMIDVFVPSPYANGQYKLKSRCNAYNQLYNVVDSAFDLRRVDTMALFDTDELGNPRWEIVNCSGVPHVVCSPISGSPITTMGCRTGRYVEDSLIRSGYVDVVGQFHSFQGYSAEYTIDSIDILGTSRLNGPTFQQGALISRQKTIDTISVSACERYLWPLWGRELDTDTIVSVRHIGELVDTVFELRLSIHPEFRHDSVVLSRGPFLWHDSLYSESTQTTYTATTIWGCDSLEYLHLTVEPIRIDTLVVEGCDSLLWGDTVYFESTMIVDTLTSVHGLDSVVVRNVVVHNSSVDVDSMSGCDSLIWYGEKYSQSGVYEYRMVGENGCDSVEVLHLELKRSSRDTLYEVVCDSFYWDATQQSYYVQAVDSVMLFSQQGCDSVVYLDLTLHRSDFGFDRETACDNYTWPHNGVTYHASTDQPYAFLHTVHGCDSTLFLQLQIRYSSTTMLDDSICLGETYRFNDLDLDQSGTYGMIFDNSLGCDSTVTLFLTVLPYPELNIEYEYSCDDGESILSTPANLPYLHWSAEPSDPSLRGQESRSTIVVTPGQTTIYTLAADYRDRTQCPVTEKVKVYPVVVPEAKMMLSRDYLTLQDLSFLACDVSHGNANGRAWYINGDYYTSKSCCWYTADPLLDSIELMLVVFSETCNDTVYDVVPIHKVNLSVPNVFTPTQESNRTFEVKGNGIVEYHISIYDRKGMVVFESDDMNRSWDGTCGGHECLTGSYVYIIRYKDVIMPRQEQVRRGQVLILR